MKRPTLMRSGTWLWLLPCSGVLLGCATSEPANSDDPVITRVVDARIPVPAAGIEGRLSIREGCLMIDDAVVFWPAGTTWDDHERRVIFEDGSSASVDADFTGGGGSWGLGDDLSGVLDQDAEAAVRDCMTRSGATSAVLTYPEQE